MENVLDDAFIEESYEFASMGKRFVNFVIDMISYYIFAIVVGTFLYVFFDLFGVDIFSEEEGTSLGVLGDYFLGGIIILCYYVPLEYFGNGRTIGKFLTKTRAVTFTNERMSLSTVFKRTLCRLIPFEMLTFLGEPMTGWHDKFSRTKVIQE